jgi:hypothetical protein
MRRSDWTPSVVPRDDDQNGYLIVDDVGRLGGAWREAAVEATDLETVIVALLDGQYKNPVRVAGFNTAEKWSHDVSAEVALCQCPRPKGPYGRPWRCPAQPSCDAVWQELGRV